MTSFLSEGSLSAIRNFRSRMVLAAILFSLIPSLAYAAGTWVVLPPQTFVRGSGAPNVVTTSFSVQNPNAIYLLRIHNGPGKTIARTTGVITLNGVRIVGPLALNPRLPYVEWPVRLTAHNQLGVELRGAQGSGISLDLIGVDIKPPTISGTVSPAPNTAHWNNSNVTVSFACSDQTSGVEFCPPPVAVTSDGINQIVSGTAIDRAGNTATARVRVDLDKTPPLMSFTMSPAPNAAGWNNSPVTVTFACTDPMSGIQSCSPPVTVAMAGQRVVIGTAIDRAGNQASINVTVKVSTSLFTLRNYGGKCLDAGSSPHAGGPVFLNACDGSPGQQIRVEEMNSNHQVRLHAGSTVIGFHFDSSASLGDPSGLPLPTEGPLTLQPETDGSSLDANRQQFFELDGDSIIAALNRNFVAQVDNARGTNGTPIVLRSRNLADAEFWDFQAIDGSDNDPTTGFVRVSTVCDVLRYIPLAVPGQPPDWCPPGGPATPAGWGTVFKVAPGTILDFSGLYPLQLPAGITLRGGRRGTTLGARFCMAHDCDENNPQNVPGAAMMDIRGSDIRITGLSLEGPSRRTDADVQTTRAVRAYDSAGVEFARTIVDHNDISGWTGAGVDVAGSDLDDKTTCDITITQWPLFHVFVKRNFLHHNREQEKGYGVVTGQGGFPLVEGNTFLANRHAIAAAGGGHTGYFAGFNLVLSEAPLQVGYGPFDWHTHDFDQHGNGDNGFGGTGGLYENIYSNTFLGTNRANYEIRSSPCYNTDFRQNITVVSQSDSLDYKPGQYTPSALTPADEVVTIQSVPPQFNRDNPTNHLASGDFDGDGVDDMFLATGAAWYYAPAGAREWRYLSNNRTPLSLLRFGDFDGDGRTDVVSVNDGELIVSWGGVSSWERLNAAPGPVTDLAVGNFVSDFGGIRRDDLLYTDGATWFLSSAGSGPFVEAQASSGFRVPDLLFGDFNGDGLTDVFRITNNIWQVSYGAASSWTPLPVSLTTSMDGLVVADFDGDGRADVAKTSDVDISGTGILDTAIFVNSFTFALSHDGETGWTNHTVTPTSDCTLTFSVEQLQRADLRAGIANVDGIRGADLLLWGAKDGNNFCIVSGGTGAAARQSGQDMR